MREYVGLIVCDTRRARAWQKAFAKAGIPARLAETIGEAAEGGAFQVSVPRRDLPAANALVTAVTRGEVALPGDAPFGRTAVIALLLVAALLAALVRA